MRSEEREVRIVEHVESGPVSVEDIPEPKFTEEELQMMEEREMKKREERKANFERYFEIEMGRKPTKEEGNKYFKDYVKGKTNFYKFIEEIKNVS